MSPARALLAIFVAALLAAPPAGAVGFQYAKAPNPDDQPIELAIWYPSDAAAAPQTIGLFSQDVAPDGAIKGNQLPLVVISHGTGGSAASHYDTALALADAGFVVVALSHTGDNYKDRSYSFTRRNFTDRPKQVSRVIDFMLNGWDGHDTLDPARIGMFGHSAGAATALTIIGGNPDLYLAVLFCRDHPDDWGCQQTTGQQSPDQQSPDQQSTASTNAAPRKPADWVSPPEWQHDPRIIAAAIAAPAIGYAFTKVGLETVTAPVQLWRAEDDKITPNRWFGDIVRDALPRAPEDHFVPKAGHFDFLAPCNDALANAAPDICDSEPGFDRTAFHQSMNKALIGFFKAQLAP